MALGDLRVLDLTRLLPGPFCTMILADLGADVIKVEDPGQGDYLRWWVPLRGETSAVFQALNRNKRSIVLDLKAAAGRDALLTLVATSDVVVESFRPGVMDRLGLGYEALRARNRGVILCSISGYGQDGPYRDRAGHDLNYMGLAGALDPVAPQPLPVQVGDVGGGAMTAVAAILAALHERTSSGEGQHCDVAMRDAVFAWQIAGVARLQATGDAQTGDLLSGSYPCYSVYRCADGHLTVGALEPKFWIALMAALDLPHLADSAFAQGEEAAAVRSEIEAVLMQHSRAQWRSRLDGLDVCVEPVLDVAEAAADMGVDHDNATAGAAASMFGFPFRLSRTPPAWRGPAPAQGEQGRQILLEAGYDDAAVDALTAEGVTR